MTSIDHGLVPIRCSCLQKLWRWWWAKDRLLRLLGNVAPVEIPACMLKLVLVVADILVILLVFIVLIVFTFCPLVITVQVGGKTLATTLRLHSSTQCLQVVTLLSPFFQFLMVSCALLCHLEYIAIRLVVFSGKREVLLLQALGLFRHFLHFFAESEEEFVAVIQCILHLKYYYYQQVITEGQS